jgi:hypothetical protein
MGYWLAQFQPRILRALPRRKAAFRWRTMAAFDESRELGFAPRQGA